VGLQGAVFRTVLAVSLWVLCDAVTVFPLSSLLLLLLLLWWWWWWWWWWW
jgi:hypothetical protein